MPVDQPAQELERAGACQQLALVRGHRQVDRFFLISDDPGKLLQGLGWDDDREILLGWSGKLRAPDRKPEAIGGGQGQHPTFEFSEYTGQDRPAVIGRRRKRDVRDHVPKRRRLNPR